MAMTSEWFDPVERDEPETEAVEREAPKGNVSKAQTAVPSANSVAPEAQKRIPQILTPLDPALKALLERTDDRLLRDVGLSRESPFAEVAKFWAEWSRQRGPWGL